MAQNEIDLEAVRAIKARHEADLLAKPGVVAVGIGLTPPQGDAERSLAIIVSMNALDAARIDLPDALEGVPVVLQVTGAFSPRSNSS